MARKDVKAIYDTCRNLVKQAEDQAAKGQEPDAAVLSALKIAFSDILEFEKVYLITCQDRLYGTLLMDLDMEIDFHQRGAVDFKANRTPFVLGVNPLFCAKYKFNEFTGLIISELLKMVYLHPAEYNRLNSEGDQTKHEMLDKASDAASNSVVKRDIHLENEAAADNGNGCRLPDGAYTPTQLNKECGVSSQEEQDLSYYYNILEKFKKSPPPGGGGNTNGVATMNNNNGQPIHQWENVDEEEVKSQIISRVSDAYNSLSEKQRGLMPSSVLSQIKKLLEPPQINWTDVFRKMVGNVPVPYRKTRAKLNRRQPERFELSGKLPKHTVNVVCAFDTSGSMSDDDLEYCMNEVFNIVKSYEGYKVTIIECDAAIGKIYEARKLSDLQLKMSGRGGTSFIPVIEYINGEGEFKNNPKYPNAGKYKDALLVYFTDGYGDYEIPKPRTYRNLWVVMEDEKNLSLKNPYGDVKSLSKDSNWRKRKGRR